MEVGGGWSEGAVGDTSAGLGAGGAGGVRTILLGDSVPEESASIGYASIGLRAASAARYWSCKGCIGRG
eukprot:595316-Prymnesium_polylepis.1